MVPIQVQETHQRMDWHLMVTQNCGFLYDIQQNFHNYDIIAQRGAFPFGINKALKRDDFSHMCLCAGIVFVKYSEASLNFIKRNAKLIFFTFFFAMLVVFI